MSANRFFALAALLLIAIPLSGCSHSAGGAATASMKAQAVHDVDAGLAREQHRDYSGAIALYDQALSADPNSAVAYYDRGAIEFRQRK